MIQWKDYRVIHTVIPVMFKVDCIVTHSKGDDIVEVTCPHDMKKYK